MNFGYYMWLERFSPEITELARSNRTIVAP
jgi:hypothetical protein